MTPTARIHLLARACLAAALLTGVGLVLTMFRHTELWSFADIRRVADITFAALALTLVLGALTLVLARGVSASGRDRRLALFGMIGATGGFCGYLFFLAACNGASSAGAR